ncbi:MAG TPA: MBL fold metallo-hydrolase [Steroidobacteraceae bacterium]|jgi:ribonuclease BN (tRNA processing enzyme)
MARVDRRQFLASATALSAAALLAQAAPAAGRTRLILLGTGGGPRPKKQNNASAQVIVAGDSLYVVDCGDGVARQLVLAGLSLDRLRHVFITHHHSDHNADYGNLLLLSWASGLRTRVDAWGPPPIAEITRLFFEMSAYDIDIRIRDEGRVPLRPLVHAHEIAGPGQVMQDDNVRVTCALVPHPMVEPAFAYRLDTADRSIVISGDTAYSEALIALAKGAEVLVHEALFLPAVDRLVARVPNAATLRPHLLASHTSAEDCGRVAAAAGVRTLVLSHFVPPDDPLVTEDMWRDAAARHFRGEIVVGRDLLEI